MDMAGLLKITAGPFVLRDLCSHRLPQRTRACCAEFMVTKESQEAGNVVTEESGKGIK